MSLMTRILYLLFGLAVTFAIPISLLLLAAKWADFQDKKDKNENKLR
jgi:uncharacterized membrane protein YuzA (DUF378 family)